MLIEMEDFRSKCCATLKEICENVTGQCIPSKPKEKKKRKKKTNGGENKEKSDDKNGKKRKI